MSTKSLDELVDLLRSQRAAMVTTVDGDKLVSRPMAPMTVDDDATLWFFTRVDTDKVDEVAENPACNVTFSHSDYLSVAGSARTVRDLAKQKELWNPVVAAWLECEPEDPQVALLKVEPDSIAYWTTPNTVASLLQTAKAIVTHEQPDLGESGVVEV